MMRQSGCMRCGSPGKKPSNRVKGTSLAPEFSSPSTSESLIGLVEDDVPKTESGNTQRKNVPNTKLGKRERLPIRNEAPDADFGNTETPPKRTDIPNTGIGDFDVLVTDFGNTERPPMRKDIPNTDFGRMDRPRIRTDIQNTDLENMDVLVGNMERPRLRKGIPNTDSRNTERPTAMMDVLDTDFGSMERPPVRLVEKPNIKGNQKNDDANKQDKERLRHDREDKEERIMLMDISTMPHQLQQYYHRRRMEILARGMGGV